MRAHQLALVGETEPDRILFITAAVSGDLRTASDDDGKRAIRCGEMCADLGRPPHGPTLDGDVILSRRFTYELKKEQPQVR